MDQVSQMEQTNGPESTATQLGSSSETENATVTYEEISDFNVHVATLVMCTIGNVFIMLLSCYGNGKILVTCCQTFKTHSNFRWLKANLSIGDFILSFSQCPMLLFLVFGTQVILNVLLPLTFFCAGLSLTVSINSISGIAIHRFVKLKCNYEIRKKFTSVFIIYTWISGALLATIFAIQISRKVDAFTVNMADVITNDKQFHIISYILITVFLVTLTVISFAYTAIAVVLVTGPSAKPASPSLARCTSKVTIPEADKTQLSKGNAIVNKHRAISSCIGIICVHIFCWLPFVLVFTFDRYISDYNLMFNIKIVAWIMVLFQSALNPYIYQVPKDPHKSAQTLYCKQCLHLPDSNVHKTQPVQGGDNETRIRDISENYPNPRTATGIFQIRMPENEQVPVNKTSST